MILGRLGPDEAGPAIGQPVNGARHTTVGTLRAAGFDVTHTPSAENDRHVSVITKGWWRDKDSEASKAFQKCFDAPVWHEEQDESRGETS
jgi:hypothetical protein